MLSVFAVNSLADVVAADGLITLREALQAANTNTAVYDAPAGSSTETDLVIIFAQDPADPGNSRITLGGNQLEILDDVDIYGPGPESLAIDANGQSRVFYVASGVEASLWGLTITGGSAQDVNPNDDSDDDGGGIYNAGALAVANVTVSGNVAESIYDGGGGGIYNVGELTVTNSTIAGNSADWLGGGRTTTKER